MTIWTKLILPVTGHFRRQRARRMLELLPSLEELSVADIGGSHHFWETVSDTLAPRSVTIFNLGREAVDELGATSNAAVELFDGYHVPVADRAFDIVICNSVIEHVPLERRAEFAAELCRVGRFVFLQTPARSFPFEPHLLVPCSQFLGPSARVAVAKVSPWRLLARPDEATIVEYAAGTELLSWREIRTLFPQLTMESERILGVTKSCYAYGVTS